MNLMDITPLILTYNEAPNIGRVLEKLRWADDIVVVDSYSTDATRDIVASFPQARFFQRKFDSHANQWNYGLLETGIATHWVLALDADYILSDKFLEEIKEIDENTVMAGFRASFLYCIEGRPLRGAAYPRITVLFSRVSARYAQDGHTQRVMLQGRVEDLQSPIMHDDRKSLSHWVLAQDRYMRLEAKKLLECDFTNLSMPDQLRRLYFLAPLGMLVYCLFIKRAIMDGRAGLYYALQRTFAELLLSLYLLNCRLDKDSQ